MSSGFYVRVKATPGVRKEEVREDKPLYLSISVREKAERNMANARICELVARHYGVPVGKVRIISGHRGHTKLLSIL